jgi:hypothetical protein
VEVPALVFADTTVRFDFQHANTFSTPEIKVNIPEGSLYDTTYFNYTRFPKRKTTFSAVHSLHIPEVPLHKRMKVSINASGVPARLWPKVLLARIDRGGRMHTAGGGYSNGFVTAETNLFDSYAIVADTVAPSIKPVGSKSKIRNSLRFTVHDNFSGIGSYRAEINGEWALLSWDPKKDLMTYVYDEKLRTGINKFRIIVSDAIGNQAIYSTRINK